MGKADLPVERSNCEQASSLGTLRLRRTVAYAKSLLEDLLLQKASCRTKNHLFTAFKRVLLQDSTTLNLPAGRQPCLPDCLRHLFLSP